MNYYQQMYISQQVILLFHQSVENILFLSSHKKEHATIIHTIVRPVNCLHFAWVQSVYVITRIFVLL